MGISDYIALSAGVVSVFAALAAWRSASSAGEATRLTVRQQRNALMREINIIANRAAVTATQVSQLAVTLVPARTQLAILYGQGSLHPATLAPIQDKVTEVSERAKQISDDANAVLFSRLESKSDEELAAELRRMDGRVVQLEAMKEEISKELAGIESDARERRAENTALRAAVVVRGHN